MAGLLKFEELYLPCRDCSVCRQSLGLCCADWLGQLHLRQLIAWLGHFARKIPNYSQPAYCCRPLLCRFGFTTTSECFTAIADFKSTLFARPIVSYCLSNADTLPTPRCYLICADPCSRHPRCWIVDHHPTNFQCSAFECSQHSSAPFDV